MSDNHNQREEVFSKSVRAGKRTYFFDVKTTKAQDYYLTITESKKRIGDTAHLLVDLAENRVVVLGHDLNVRPCLLPDKPANTLSF